MRFPASVIALACVAVGVCILTGCGAEETSSSTSSAEPAPPPSTDLRRSCVDGYDDDGWPVQQCGYVDASSGEVVIERRFRETTPFQGGVAIVKTASERHAFIDSTGAFLDGRRFDAVRFSGRYVVVRTPSGAGILDRLGNEVVPVGRFDAIVETPRTARRPGETTTLIHEGGVFAVGQRQPDGTLRYGVATFDRLMVPATYAAVERIRDDTALMRVDDAEGAVQNRLRVLVRVRTGERLTEPYRWIEPFSDGHAAVLADSLWGFVDTTGTVVVSPRYRGVSAFDDGRALVDSSGVFSVRLSPERAEAAKPNRVTPSTDSSAAEILQCPMKGEDGAWACMVEVYGSPRIDRSLVYAEPRFGEQSQSHRVALFDGGAAYVLESGYESTDVTLRLPDVSFADACRFARATLPDRRTGLRVDSTDGSVSYVPEMNAGFGHRTVRTTDRGVEVQIGASV